MTATLLKHVAVITDCGQPLSVDAASCQNANEYPHNYINDINRQNLEPMAGFFVAGSISIRFHIVPPKAKQTNLYSQTGA